MLSRFSSMDQNKDETDENLVCFRFLIQWTYGIRVEI